MGGPVKIRLKIQVVYSVCSSKSRSVGGFSVLETVISLGVLSVLAVIWFSSQSGDIQLRKRASSLLAAVIEHRAVSAWAEAIPKSQAVVASKLALQAQPPSATGFCYPHPYSSLSGDNCVNVQLQSGQQLAGLGMTFGQALQNWKELSDATLEWASRSKAAISQSQLELDQTYFDSTIRPKLAAAGCMTCHGSTGLSNSGSCSATPTSHRSRTYPAALKGSGSWNAQIGLTEEAHNGHLYGRGQVNYNCFEELTRPFAARTLSGVLYQPPSTNPALPPPNGNPVAVADLMLVGSPLGAALLQKEFTLKDFGNADRLVESGVSLKSRQMTTSVPARRQRVLTLDNVECRCPPTDGRNATAAPWPSIAVYSPNYGACRTRLTTPPSAPGGEVGAGPPPNHFCRFGEEFVPNSCLDTCIEPQPPILCTYGKGNVQPCGPPRCNKYRSTYACFSSVQIDEAGIPNRPANEPPLANYSALPNANVQDVPISECLKADDSLDGVMNDSQGPCGVMLCSNPAMANATSGVCIEDRANFGGYCRVRCTQGTFINVTFGKGNTQSVWNGCARIQINYLCVTQLPPTSISSSVVEYTIRTSVFKPVPNQPGQRQIDGTHSMQGVIGP